MKNPLHDYLSHGEQKILLFLCTFLLLGSILQLAGYQPTDSKPAANDSLEQALANDIVLKIDIRSASKAELMALKGIGDKRASDIIEYRAKNPFQNVNDLLKVSGIGPKTYQKLYPDLLIFGDSLATTAASPSSASSAPKADATAIVHLNSANLEELCTLQGIGPVKAKAILDYRNEYGAFQSVEELTKVPGIGPKTLQKNLQRLAL